MLSEQAILRLINKIRQAITDARRPLHRRDLMILLPAESERNLQEAFVMGLDRGLLVRISAGGNTSYGLPGVEFPPVVRKGLRG